MKIFKSRFKLNVVVILESSWANLKMCMQELVNLPPGLELGANMSKFPNFGQFLLAQAAKTGSTFFVLFVAFLLN